MILVASNNVKVILKFIGHHSNLLWSFKVKGLGNLQKFLQESIAEKTMGKPNKQTNKNR